MNIDQFSTLQGLKQIIVNKLALDEDCYYNPYIYSTQPIYLALHHKKYDIFLFLLELPLKFNVVPEILYKIDDINVFDLCAKMYLNYSDGFSITIADFLVNGGESPAILQHIINQYNGNVNSIHHTSGLTPLAIAHQKNLTSIIELLIKFNAKK